MRLTSTSNQLMTCLQGYGRVTVSKHALLVMDVQRAVVDRFPDPAYLPRLRQAIGATRTAGVPVIYVVVGFRDGYPEISPRNKIFGRIAHTSGLAAGDDATQVHPEVAPEAGDIVVTKRRVSAFAGSDLD